MTGQLSLEASIAHKAQPSFSICLCFVFFLFFLFLQETCWQVAVLGAAQNRLQWHAYILVTLGFVGAF